MQALSLTSFGSPLDAFRFERIETPRPLKGEVLVKVEACALNHLDLWIRQGKPAPLHGLPHILGSDIAGTVAEIGQNVTNCTVGQRVVVQPGLSCEQCVECMAGKHNECKQYTTIGMGHNGGYSEFCCVPAQNIVPIPKNLSFSEAACLPLVLTTTYHMIVTKGNLQRGHWVLVQGASSGVGSMAIQVVKALGGKVIATASSEEKSAFGISLGADYVLTKDIVNSVKEITQGQGVSLALEHTGIGSFADSLACLKIGGTLVSCGATVNGKYPLDLTKLFWLRQSLIGSRMGRKSDLIEGMKLVEAGLIKGVIAKEFALQEGAQAHEFLASRQAFGKVVLKGL
jgi:NADPH:quinone reductase-like Zn-dependent oxidoreductase